VVEAPTLGTDTECNAVITIIAVHEDRRDHILAHAEFVFDAAAHSERGIEALRGGRIVLAHDAMAETTGGGFEASMHPAPRMKRLTELDFGAVKDLDRVAAWVRQLHHFEHAPLGRLIFRADADLDAGGLELMLHLGELRGAGHAEAEVFEVVGPGVVKYESVMPVVHSQVAAVAFAVG
jgi:hypothetical protein